MNNPSKPSPESPAKEQPGEVDGVDGDLRWALAAVSLVENGLRNRRGLKDDDVEMRNLKAVKTSIENARAKLPPPPERP